MTLILILLWVLGVAAACIGVALGVFMVASAITSWVLADPDDGESE